jgi:glycosyltransferase involved in cell wall biosynthesis
VKILMVSPYAPIRDGIASYALQQVKALRAEGHDVEVLSPQPSAAHHHLNLRSVRGPLALAKRVRHFDRVIIQFHPDVFYVEGTPSALRTPTTMGLLAVATLAKHLEVLVHEIDYDLAKRRTLDSMFAREFWRRVDRLTVHTEAEAQRMSEAFGLPTGRVEVVDHGSHFVKRVEIDQAAARERLGLPVDGHVFLSIGFIQPHKGFDRAVRAFRGLPPETTSLHVVGSVRVEERQYLEHLDDLRTEVDSTPGAHLHDTYVSDELFDVWLVAADTVVLPYRHIWSSSVLERAAMYERAIIASRVGGLAAQAPDGTVLVDTDDELAQAMADSVSRWLTRDGSPSGVEAIASMSAPWPSPEHSAPDHDDIQTAVVARADEARGRPLLGDQRLQSSAALSRRHRSGGARSLDRLEPLELPPPTSTRPVVGLVKRLVLLCTAWLLNPMVERINQLQRATAEALANQNRPDERDPLD